MIRVEAIPALLSSLIILLMIEIISRRLRQNSSTKTNSIDTLSSKRVQALANGLVLKLEQVQDDFCDLERRCNMHRVHEEETEVAHMIDSMYDTFIRPGSRLANCPPPGRNRRRRRLSSLCNGYETDALDTSRMSGAFTSFCERLLAMNRIWKQEKQLKMLQLGVRSAAASQRTNAFHGFCHKLILHNKVWRLEKQVGELELETATLKKRFAATIKRAAQKMMEELQHDRLVKGYVKDLHAELDSYKLTLGVQSALHEHELKEFTWEWCQEYWKLVREVEKLSLAQQASSVQQDLQNDLEDSLYDSLRTAQKRVEELDERLEGYQHSLVDVPIGDDDHETTASSSVTCVSLDGRDISSPARKSFTHLPRMPMTPRNIRSARWIDRSKRQVFTRPKKLILGKHTGFSFNPLFYDPNVSPFEQWKSRQWPFDKEPSNNIRTEICTQAKNTGMQSGVQRWRI